MTLSLITLSPPKDYIRGIIALTHRPTRDGVTYQENFATAQMMLPAGYWFNSRSVLLVARVFMRSHRKYYNSTNCM